MLYDPAQAVNPTFYTLNPTAISRIDARHVAVGTAIWTLPELRNQSKFLREPFGGWRMRTIIHLQSGFYQTVSGSTDILGTRVADYIGGPTLLPNPGPNGWNVQIGLKLAF